MREAKIYGDTVNCEAGEGSGDFVEKVLNESGEPRGRILRVCSEAAERLVKELGMLLEEVARLLGGCTRAFLRFCIE